MRVMHTEMETVPLLGEPCEDGVVVGLAEVWDAIGCACQAQPVLLLEQVVPMRLPGCGFVIGTPMSTSYTASSGSGAGSELMTEAH